MLLPRNGIIIIIENTKALAIYNTLYYIVAIFVSANLKKKIVDAIDLEILRQLNQPQAVQERDENILFVLSLVDTLKRLDHQKKSIVKLGSRRSYMKWSIHYHSFHTHRCLPLQLVLIVKTIFS